MFVYLGYNWVYLRYTWLHNWYIFGCIFGTSLHVFAFILIVGIYLYSCRLQLKRGVFWYRHYPKMHEMVSDRSYEQIFRPIFAKFQCASFQFEKGGKMTIWSQNTKIMIFVKQSLRSYVPHTKVGKNKCSDRIYSSLNNLIIYN